MKWVILLFVLTSWGEEGSAPEGEKAKEGVTLKFRRPAGEEAFNQAKACFEKREWKEAESLLRKARSQAADVVTKYEVSRWTQGIEGGRLVEFCEKLVKGGRIHDAFFQIQKGRPKYHETPAEPVIRAFIEELRPKVAETIENFEGRGPYSQKYGKTFVSDPAYVMQGTYALQWVWVKVKGVSTSWLQIKEVPRDWSPFSHLGFWLYFPPRKSAKIEVYVKSPGAATYTNARAYQHILTPHEGWKYVMIELGKMKKGGTASFSNVEALQLQIKGSKFTAYVDDFVLIRKPQGAETKEEKAPG